MSLKDGPSTLRSIAWQLMQFFEVAKARSAKAGAAALRLSARSTNALFMAMVRANSGLHSSDAL
jgi:hypothetical protein